MEKLVELGETSGKKEEIRVIQKIQGKALKRIFNFKNKNHGS